MYQDIIRCVNKYQGELTLLTTVLASQSVLAKHCHRQLLTNISDKHHCLSHIFDEAILIGGGARSLGLVNKILALDKPIITMTHSQGIVATQLPANCIYVLDVMSAISVMAQQLTFNKL
ncbi:MAG: hypothetical protein HRU25_03030 [Psychrobium sp.]|nr:hypothetical protein [Psychrobium sp.]